MQKYFESDTVCIKISCPKNIAKQPVTAVARLTQTWEDFLNKDCGIRVSVKDGIVVRTLRNSGIMKANGKQWGWIAELNEKIGVFMNKYDVRRPHNTVYLMRQKNDILEIPPPSLPKADAKRPQLVPVSAQKSKPRKEKDVKGLYRKPRFIPSSRESRSFSGGGGYCTRARILRRPVIKESSEDCAEKTLRINRVRSMAFEKRSKSVAEEDPLQIDTSFEQPLLDDFLDAASVGTTESDEASQLRIEGFQVKDVKTLVEYRVSKFSESFYVKAAKEVLSVKESGKWIKNVESAPLAFYFVEELLSVKTTV